MTSDERWTLYVVTHSAREHEVAIVCELLEYEPRERTSATGGLCHGSFVIGGLVTSEAFVDKFGSETRIDSRASTTEDWPVMYDAASKQLATTGCRPSPRARHDACVCRCAARTSYAGTRSGDRRRSAERIPTLRGAATGPLRSSS
jgi:hypothetical protein